MPPCNSRVKLSPTIIIPIQPVHRIKLFSIKFVTTYPPAPKVWGQVSRIGCGGDVIAFKHIFCFFCSAKIVLFFIFLQYKNQKRDFIPFFLKNQKKKVKPNEYKSVYCQGCYALKTKQYFLYSCRFAKGG